MKKNKIYIFIAVLFAAFFSACSEDDLSSESVITEAQRVENDFDRWIVKNYVTPYNIDFKYRMEDIESDRNYNLIPADYTKSVQLAKLVEFLCLQVYDEVTGGKKFIRDYFPKMIHLVGSPAYENNGTMVLGTAEGGLKITLYNVNNVDVLNVSALNYFYFKTIHHEFAHILHQTRPYPTAFKEISGSEYVKDSWSSAWGSGTAAETAALKAGFITPYASSAVDEDFVELIAVYVTNTEAYWQSRIKTAGTTGAPIINSKFEIVYNYMLDTWNIDLDILRNTVLDHQNRIGELDLDEL